MKSLSALYVETECYPKRNPTIFRCMLGRIFSKKTLDNGKTLKKPKSKSEAKTTTGYHVFVKTNHTKIKEQNCGMTSDQVRKLVAAEWKSLGLVGQQVYKDLARNGEKEVQETQGIDRKESGNQGRSRENQLNRITPSADQGRIHACNVLCTMGRQSWRTTS